MEIKQLTLKDTAELYALIHVSRWDLPNMRWASEATFESTALFIDTQTSVEKHFAVLIENNIAGLIGVRERKDHLQLGYWLGSWYRNQGIMTLAVGKFLEDVYHHFLKKPLRVRISETNQKSLAVAKKNGFKEVCKDAVSHIILARE